MGAFLTSADLKEVQSIKKIRYLKKKNFPDFSHPWGGATHPHSSAQGVGIKNRPGEME